MLAFALSAFLALVQASQTGTVVGLVKLPDDSKPAQAAHVTLLPPKYADMWNKQVQQRLDNYWEIFKPELLVNKDHVTEILRMAHLESFRFVTSAMRRELGDGRGEVHQGYSRQWSVRISRNPFRHLSAFRGNDSGRPGHHMVQDGRCGYRRTHLRGSRPAGLLNLNTVDRRMLFPGHDDNEGGLVGLLTVLPFVLLSNIFRLCGAGTQCPWRSDYH